MLDPEEYVEQAYAFRAMRERLEESEPIQAALADLRQEVLATTRLPLALDFLLTELRHGGSIGPAMRRIGHYFSPFQAYLIEEAEDEHGRFDMRTALEILRFEAEMRSKGPSPQTVFFFAFECLCRNRLRYGRGLDALAGDLWFSPEWRSWIASVRDRIGLLELSDMIYVRSEHYLTRKKLTREEAPEPPLFTEKEGRIALANRKKEPLYLFSALQRHLGYPAVPRLRPITDDRHVVQALQSRVSLLETRLKMMEEEQKSGAVDLAKLFPPGFRGTS